MFRMRRWWGGALLLALLNLSGIYSKDSTEENQKPFFEEKIYHGEVRENSADIVLHPILFARDDDEGLNGQICDLRIVDETKDFPFELELLDQATGEGAVRVSNVDKIDCEAGADYTFHVQAYDCGKPQRKSHRTQVHIVITDENDNAPRFLKSAYQVTVDEGAILDNIVQVEAVDDDCSPAYSTVCGYEITTPDVPFTVDKAGQISTTEPLSTDYYPSYVFSVVAFDCADKRSSPVLVTVMVQKMCTPGWKGIPKRIEYFPGSGDRFIAKKAYLETCAEPKCNSSDVMVEVKLQTNHIGFGCDRETYSTQSQRKLCGAAPGSYDLLPTPNVGEKWTEDLNTDQGHDSDQIYEFDGVESAVIIPKKFAPQNLTDRFSISFWMKHGVNHGGNKEHILCNSDQVGLSRHHHSIYIHNCRLVFLLRREAGDIDSFYPTEFRWKLAETCDKEWHRYTLNVNYPEVSRILYVDGALHQTNRISDDWPLHHSNYPTTLTVGACWEGGDNLYIDHFSGYLAGLSILVGKIENHEVITCMYGCKEGLSFQVGDLPVKVAQFNPSRTELTLEGDLVGGKLSKVVQKVGYVNSRTFPTPGQRPLIVTTTAICDGESLPIPDVNAYIMVLQPVEPTITISGPQHIARTVDNLQAGILPFTGVTVVSLMSQEMEEEEDEFIKEDDTAPDALLSISHNLDSCSVTVDTPMQEGEILEIPADELAKWHLTKLNSSEGIIIKGVDTIEHYQSLLRAVMYANAHAQDLLSRTFKIMCTELNGRFTSNEFTVQINVLHRKIQSSSNLNHAKSGHHVQMAGYKPGSEGLRAKMEKRLPADKLAKATASSTAMTVVIVICVGFLVFMIVLGVFRIYAAHRDSTMEDKQDMDWDDSALNITVNPMDGPVDTNEDDDDTSDEDDDESGQDELDSSDEDEDEEEEEETHVEIKGTALEWDDSTLKF
ncbi:calsyntenin-1-like [Amphiura filiformis]|uniref:calsyntenin-1-like n=1 Tax=Amphiura filiformis TaxID=82378 RepID=UPI003B21DD05